MSLQAKYITIAILFVIHFILGYVLSRSGEPYNTAILTIHKLASLAALVLIVLAAWQLRKETGLDSLAMAAVVITVILFVTTILTGGALSADLQTPGIITVVHKVFPYLTVISTVVTIYLLSFRST
jgi:hypothetical protein